MSEYEDLYGVGWQKTLLFAIGIKGRCCWRDPHDTWRARAYGRFPCKSRWNGSVVSLLESTNKHNNVSIVFRKLPENVCNVEKVQAKFQRSCETADVKRLCVTPGPWRQHSLMYKRSIYVGWSRLDCVIATVEMGGALIVTDDTQMLCKLLKYEIALETLSHIPKYSVFKHMTKVQ